MGHSVTDTCDASVFDTKSDVPSDISERRRAPQLRILYHVDLARVGAFSHPELALEGGEWQLIGRARPLFITPTPRDRWRPLEDPTISREQLRVRWRGDVERFELEPVARARRRVFLIDPRRPGERVAVTEPTLAPPGACVAIDDRLLLGLELHARHRGPEAERMGLVGEDPAIWRLRDEIGEIGEFRKPVLILGETGTGKELIAGALHRYGRASAGPYQTLNCAALPDQLVESLLFGHVKGAFTGASGPQEGVFRAADGGTLFLDELGEMPTSIQPKLLRTLQDGVVTALGQHRGVKVDVRLVAATNRDPEQEIAAGRLRADLYHRVAAHVIRVPTLASRPFDVPALFVHFLARSREEHPALEWLWSGPERWRATAPMSFFTTLMAYPWPGNIRELENISERTARMNLRGKPFSSPALDGPSRAEPAQPRAPIVADAPTRKRAGDHAERARAASRVLGIAAKTVAKLLDVEALAAVWAEVDPADEAALSDRLEREAKERLYACLIEQEFAQGPVARRLGVSPWTLIRLMQRFGLARPTELTHEQIERALVDADGDLARAARSLEVSEHGLKQRLAALERSR